MALVQTHRFNWMGYEGTESQALNLALLRPSDAGNLRYSDYQQRQQVVKEIEMRLKLIKRDLGLLPQEDILKYLQEDEARRSLSPDRKLYAENIMSTVEKRRKDLRHLNVLGGTSPAEGTKFNLPRQPSVEEIEAIYGKFNAAVHSILFYYGMTFVSYMDGTEFTQLNQLAEHNKLQRVALQEKLTAAGVTLPAESLFDVKPIKAAMERRDTLRKKLDALRAQRDPTYAIKCIRKEELDAKGEPITTVLQADGNEQEIVKKLIAAQKKLHVLRSSYNAQAHAFAQQVLKTSVLHTA